MIEIFTGTPGSGKSLHAASRLCGLLRSGHLVIVNFEIDRKRVPNPDLLVILDNTKLKTPKFVRSVIDDYWATTGKHVREGQIVLFIDEAQLLFNSREWSKTQGSGWISFFTQHRKYGVDIVLVAQFIDMIDRQVRSLIEYEHIHRKISNFGGVGFIAGIFLLLVNLFTFGKLFVGIKIWVPLKQRVGAEFFVARPGLYRIYDTYKVWE